MKNRQMIASKSRLIAEALLEMNVVNREDIDREVQRLAARLYRKPCPACSGTGSIKPVRWKPSKPGGDAQTCPTCSGEGGKAGERCPTCNNLGNVKPVDWGSAEAGEALSKTCPKCSGKKVFAPAAQWFTRTASYWLNNLDKLKEPMNVEAEPRPELNVSDYNVEPFNRSADLRPKWIGKEPQTKPNVCQTCKGNTVTKDSSGNYVRCASCNGTGLDEKPYAGGEFCETCEGSGTVKMGPLGDYIPAKRNEKGSEGVIDCQACSGTGMPPAKPYKKPEGREGFFAGESLIAYLVGEAEGYDPEKRQYSTVIHAQPKTIECPRCTFNLVDKHKSAKYDIDPDCPICGGTGKTKQRTDRDIEQNFAPIEKGSAAKYYGDPPGYKDLPDYFKKETPYYFNPAHAGQRELFQRLQSVVHLLNYCYKIAERPAEPTRDEIETLSPSELDKLKRRLASEKRMALGLIQEIEHAPAQDADLFHKIITKAESFIHDVNMKPDLFVRGGPYGQFMREDPKRRLVMRKATKVAQITTNARKPTYNGKEATWCLRNESNASSYAKSAPVYFIELNGNAYIAIHLPINSGSTSSQVHDVTNTPVARMGPEHVDNVARMMAPFPQDFPVDFVRGYCAELGNALQEYRSGARR